MKILVVEDDKETAGYLADGLTELGHVVDVAVTGRDGLFLATGDTYGCLIVDRMLPGLDGLSMVRAIRASGSDAPILFLTTMAAIGDRVDGFDAGGDDYLVKPFAFRELTAARRQRSAVMATTLAVGNIHIDLSARRVLRGGRAVELQPREFRLLECLMRNNGRVMTRTMLLEQVWDFHFEPRTNVVETHVSRLRSKLNLGSERDPIRTVRGSGYVLDADT
jgi:two-component system OmpR family response regulator